MKILHLIQKNQLRGAEVFAAQLSTQINLAGHEAVIVYLFQGTATLPFNGRIIALGANPGKRMLDLRAWRNLARIVREEQPDIIQANAGDTLKYAVFSKLFFRWKQPIVFRNASMISLYIKSATKRMYNGFFFRYASRILSVSEASKADFARLYPAAGDKLITIPTGIQPVAHTEHASTPSDGKPFIEGLRPVIVHVGGFSFEKNHARLLHIYKAILKRVPTASLHLVGDGPLRKQVEEMVTNLGITSSVVFHGFRPNPLDFIRTANVLVLPSIIEGLPGVILEAFYCNTPVVAYNVGGISEILINGRTGRTVPLHDEEAFASSVIDALEPTDENQALIARANRLVMDSYQTPDIAARFVQEYKAVLAPAMANQHTPPQSTTFDIHQSK